MAAQLLAEAISEYQQSLQGIAEALAASPDEQELLEVRGDRFIDPTERRQLSEPLCRPPCHTCS